MTKPKRITTILIATLAATTLACGTKPINTDNPTTETTTETTESTEPSPLGKTLSNKDISVVVDDITYDIKSSNQYQKPDGIYIGAHITITINTDKYYVTPSSWKLTANDGTTWTAESLTVGFDNPLKFQNLSQGEKTQGTIIFDINPDTTGDITITHQHSRNDPLTWAAKLN